MQIRIKQYTFLLDEPYTEGTVLTAGEAQALNALRAENVRNNVSKLVDNELAVLAKGELLPKEVLEGLQQQITVYSRAYRFLARHQPGNRPGALEAECQIVAQTQVTAALAAGNEVLTVEELRTRVAEVALSDGVQDQARKNLEARNRVAERALEDLI